MKLQRPKIDKEGVLYLLSLLLSVGIIFWFSYQTADLRNLIITNGARVVEGPQGPVGASGTSIVGPQGLKGDRGGDGEDSTSTVTTIIKETPIPGEKGETGPQGEPGQPAPVIREREYRLNPDNGALEWRYVSDFKWLPAGEETEDE